MGLSVFQGAGFEITYFPSLFGKLDYISLELSYKNDGTILLNNQSLFELRNWLCEHNVTSLKFNIFNHNGRYDKTYFSLQKYSKLATILGELISSVPTIKKVYIDKIIDPCGSLNPYKEAFMKTLTKVLETSLAHPSLIIDASWMPDGFPPHLSEQSFYIDYTDQRNLGQKFYDFITNIPILGKLIRLIYNHKNEEEHFEQALKALDIHVSETCSDLHPETKEADPVDNNAYLPLYSQLEASSASDQYTIEVRPRF